MIVPESALLTFSRRSRERPRARIDHDLRDVFSDTSDPLGVTSFATHHLPLEQAPQGYEIFRNKDEGCIKVVLQP